MIAHSGSCGRGPLKKLLDNELNAADERRLVDHLSSCTRCREELGQMAGTAELWAQTRAVLGDSTELSLSPVQQDRMVAGDSNEQTESWIIRLLQKVDDPEVLGLLDGRPVRSIIGQGGMGVVLKVWDAELHRPLAVKLLSPMLSGNALARQRFFREAQAAAAVVHPNIVPIYAVTSDSALPYIVMPLIGGGNLQQKLERTGPLPLVEVLSIGLQIAEALTIAHAQGLVHRDIKPANILLDEGGHRVLLSDFGLARTLDDASMTSSGMVTGTPHFMSPEQARGESVDARSDLYSLGAVLYTLATGRPPFRGESALAVLRRVCDDAYRPAFEVNESLPAWFDRVIARFMEKTAAHRIADAEAAAELLRSCLGHVRAPSRIALPSEIRHNFTKRHRKMLVSLIAAATMGLATIPFWRSDFGDPDTDARINSSSYSSNALRESARLGSEKNPVLEHRQTYRREPHNASANAFDVATNATRQSNLTESSVSSIPNIPVDNIDNQLMRLGEEIRELKNDLHESNFWSSVNR